jgi:hypothetical protein
LIPKGFGILVVAGLFGGGWIVFDEPGEVLGIIDLLAKHLFVAGGVK